MDPLTAPGPVPCAVCGTPITRRGRRRPGTAWYCPKAPCQADRARRAADLKRRRGGVPVRTASTCEFCGGSYYPTPGRVSADGALCSRRACHWERSRRRRVRLAGRGESAS